MKKLARFFGLIGGIGAIAYLLRDRLISLTAPREPEPPRFQPMPAADRPAPGSDAQAGAESTGGGTTDDLTVILGIGPSYAGRLADAGVTTFAELAGRDPAELAQAIDVAESKVSGWVTEAADR